MTDYNLKFVYHEGRENLVFDSFHMFASLNWVEELNQEFDKFNLKVIWEGQLKQCLGALAIQALFLRKLVKFLG